MAYGGDEHDHEPTGESPDDEGRFRPPRALPDPLDRLWMHPSELSPRLGAGVAAGPRPRVMWTTTLLAGAAGAILTLAVLGATGALDRPAEHATRHAVVPTSAPIATGPAVAVAVGQSVVAVGQSVVAVSVRDKAGMRRGSGVCVRRAKEIITSYRLIGSSSNVSVTTSDGVVHPARVLGRDATTDLVLLGLDTGVPAARSASHAPSAGDTVWVVGAPSPGDTTPWMSTGMVASTDSLVALVTGPTTSGLLETGAASGTASSGGALVNASGAVTGIVLSPVGNGRMTYAVPIATALSIVDDLRSHGHATHGALGITGIDAAAGPTVTGMVPDGPAAKAGVRIGDVVESVDKHDVDSMEDVMALVRHDSPGQPIVVQLRRGTRTIALNAKLSALVGN